MAQLQSAFAEPLDLEQKYLEEEQASLISPQKSPCECDGDEGPECAKAPAKGGVSAWMLTAAVGGALLLLTLAGLAIFWFVGGPGAASVEEEKRPPQLPPQLPQQPPQLPQQPPQQPPQLPQQPPQRPQQPPQQPPQLPPADLVDVTIWCFKDFADWESTPQVKAANELQFVRNLATAAGVRQEDVLPKSFTRGPSEAV